jgi:hypothetical protein
VFPFNKIIVLALTVLALGAGAAVAASRGGASDDLLGATTSTATSTVADVKGPCDEAEHASDPRCAGAQVPEDNDQAENEDANDDNGQANDDGPNHDVNDDNGGDDSGPSADSGHGGGGDDSSGSDHSGHGGGDDD